MPGSQAAERYVSEPLAADAAPLVAQRGIAALSWAVLASTLHRIRGGEGALLAINLSLVAYAAESPGRAVAQTLVSVLAIGLMYAFNDVYDAPSDGRNPKKDAAVVATYIAQRRTGTITILALKALTVALSLAVLGPVAAAAVLAVMLVNLVYSVWLKGVPVIDVAWCGLWGALYAAIVTTSGAFLVLVGLMTAVCHLFQALDDRDPDAANGIVTTAVRSAALSRNVLIALSAMLFVALYPHVGALVAASAFTPLLFFMTARSARMAWLLTKAYFAVMWLSVLGVTGAAG